MCNLCCMFPILILLWNRLFTMQWNVCDWEIFYEHGVTKICLCCEHCFQKSKTKWQQGKNLVQVMVGFKNICGLPLIYGAIDYTQIHIQKLEATCATNFFPTSQKVTICNYKLLSTMRTFPKCVCRYVGIYKWLKDYTTI